MKKNLFFAAAALVLLAGCSSNEVTEDSESKAKSAQVPVTFGTYVGQTAVTRAGTAGTIDNDAKLQTSSGFGVFAYYTDNKKYSNEATPNFMYNQKVYYDDGSWTYEPIKYWPNETGTVNNEKVSDKTDYLTFFAYAPHVSSVLTGETKGITALSANDKAGDPTVSYTVATNPSESVDLLWGVANTTTWKNVTGTDQTLETGKPFTNLIKPVLGQKIAFNFKHALAKLSIEIQGAFDKTTAEGTLQDGTKITVESVEITPATDFFYSSGDLNLNNTAGEPLWTNTKIDTDFKLGVSGEELNSTIKDSGNDEVQTIAGVTNTPTNLYANKDDAFMVIPPTSAPTGNLAVKITYYTTTADSQLKGGCSRVKNVITKTISGSSFKMEAGNAYTLLLTLGMTSVKVSATVATWEDATTQTAVDLPINVE